MNRIDAEQYDPSLEPAGDKAHRLVRTAIGLLPAASGAALEVFNSFVEDPYQRRRTRWLHHLTSELNELHDCVEEIKADSKRSDAVLSAILQTTDVAVRTGDADIHQRLIAIVLNTIKDQHPSEELLSMFLSTIRQLTSSHLKLLGLIASRKRYVSGDQLAEKEREFFLEIDSHLGISPGIPRTRLLNDLQTLSLIESPPGSPATLGGSSNYCTKAITDFGNAFRNYISCPQK